MHMNEIVPVSNTGKETVPEHVVGTISCPECNQSDVLVLCEEPGLPTRWNVYAQNHHYSEGENSKLCTNSGSFLKDF